MRICEWGSNADRQMIDVAVQVGSTKAMLSQLKAQVNFCMSNQPWPSCVSIRSTVRVSKARFQSSVDCETSGPENSEIDLPSMSTMFKTLVNFLLKS